MLIFIASNKLLQGLNSIPNIIDKRREVNAKELTLSVDQSLLGDVSLFHKTYFISIKH